MRKNTKYHGSGMGLTSVLSAVLAAVLSFGMLMPLVTQPACATGPETAGLPDGRVVIMKTDENGKLLAGAKLQILDSEKKEVIEEFTSADKAAGFTLPAGVYYLHETEAPEGYTPAEDAEFEVRAGGILDPSKTYVASNSHQLNDNASVYSVEIEGESYLVTCGYPPKTGPSATGTEYRVVSEETYLQSYGVSDETASGVRRIIREYQFNAEEILNAYFIDAGDPPKGLYWAARIAIEKTICPEYDQTAALDALRESYPDIDQAYEHFLEAASSSAETGGIRIVYLMPVSDTDRYQPLIIFTGISERTEVTLMNTPKAPDTPQTTETTGPKDEAVGSVTTVTTVTPEPAVKKVYHKTEDTGRVREDYADDSKARTKTVSKGVDTGDSAMLYIWIMVLITAGALFVIEIIRRMRGSG